MRFFWFLPTGGDSRTLAGAAHGTDIGAAGSRSVAERPASLEYLGAIARAADTLGYEGVLTPTGAHCEDAWIATAALIAQTRQLKFLVAFRPGLVAPAVAAQMAATFQQLSSGRLLLNVVAGSGDAEQRGFGDQLGHDERYDRAEEFLDVVQASWTGQRFDHHGRHFELEGAQLRQPPSPLPRVYLGGSSKPALDLAAKHANTYLTWGEPVELVAEKIAEVRELVSKAGRSISAGLRIHVISRDTAEEAWEAADQLIAGVDEATITARQNSLRTLESVGQQRMLALHGGSRDKLVIAPNLWAGIGLVRGGAGTALVGSHEQVAERIRDYAAAGIDEFILSGYPHLEEVYRFAECVRPLV